MTKIEAKSVYDCYGKLVTALLPPYYGIRHLCRNAVKMATLVVSYVSSRSSCSAGYCPFNYNLKHGANPADEYFSLSNEASSHVFQGESAHENVRVLRMTCIESGSYVLQFSSHYANVSNPLIVYGTYSLSDKTYSYADNGKEVCFFC